MSELPAVAPNLLAETLDGLAGRVRRRADALAGERESWVLRTVDDGLEVDLGEVVALAAGPGDTLTEAGQVRCSCLLAPRCAHRAAVLLAGPVAARSDPGEEREREGEEAHDPEDGPGEGGDRHLDEGQRQVLDLVDEHLALLLTGGAHRADAEVVAALTADLQRLRVHRFVVAERALTAVLQGVDAVRAEATGDARSALVRAVGTLALNVYSLRRADAVGQVDDELLGQERQTYHAVGGLTLHPACVEPVMTGSGFAGVVVTLIDGRERVWTLSRIVPADLAGVGQRYSAGVDWAGLSCDAATLARSKVVVAGATASATGRLGGGKGVRASLVGAAAPAWERLAHADSRWQVLEGEIVGGGPTGLVLETAHGRLDLEHVAAARRDADGLALLARSRGTRLRVLARSEGAGRVVLGLHPLDDTVRLPESLAGHLWPGLDLVRREWFGELHRDEHLDTWTVEEITAWQPAPSSVREILSRWLTRAVLDGAGAVRGGEQALGRDARTLVASGAPFAADLLGRLAEATRAGSTSGGWRPDAAAFVRAWLRVSQY